VVQIPAALSWLDAVAETTKALRSGGGCGLSGTLEDGTWGGRSDFLVKVEKPSPLGSWSYEVAETKLARSARANAVLQLWLLSEVLAQRRKVSYQNECTWVLGDSKVESFAVASYIAYFRKVRNDFLRGAPARVTYPEPVELCRRLHMVFRLRTNNDTPRSFVAVAGITRNQRKQFSARNIQTLEALGTLKLPVLPKDRSNRRSRASSDPWTSASPRKTAVLKGR